MAMHARKHSTRTRRLDLVLDAIMVSHTVVLYVQFSCAQLFFDTSTVIRCME
jgi:hypothetical protein